MDSTRLLQLERGPISSASTPKQVMTGGSSEWSVQDLEEVYWKPKPVNCLE